jgi:hypothetical protein
MEITKEELAAVAQTFAEMNENHSVTLGEYELAIVGGGIGDVIVA